MDNSFDVIVVGGGLTGVAAAVAASREGAKVLIVEQYGFLGGAATNSYVNPFMCYDTEKNSGEKEIVNAGIFAEILKRLDELGGLHPNRSGFNEEIMKIVLDRMAAENGVKVLFHSFLCKAKNEEGTIKSITVANKSGLMELSADYFIDCTGDADLAALAGCSYHIGREGDNQCQPMTLCFRVANIDEDEFWKNWHLANNKFNEMQKEGKIKNTRENLLLFHHLPKGVIHFNSTRILGHSGVDAWDFSAAETEAREQVFELYSLMKDYAKGFENSYLMMSAPQTGVRESRMIEGEYTITEDDIVSCKKFDDSIACGAYGVDIHSPDGSGTRLLFIEKGNYYTIPYRALIPKTTANLLVAGRCISSTHEAQSAYRVMPICCCIGEGAGLAASIANKAKSNVRDIDINNLHMLIEKYGGKYC